MPRRFDPNQDIQPDLLLASRRKSAANDSAAKQLTKDEARRIAAKIAKLPNLPSKGS